MRYTEFISLSIPRKLKREQERKERRKKSKHQEGTSKLLRQ